LKLNSTIHLLACVEDVNILGGSIDTVKKNAEALLAAIKEIGLEVNAHSIQEEIKSRLKSGNDCYYSLQNLLSSRLLS